MTMTDALLALLDESEVAADDELGDLLADLQALGAGPVPSPGPELAALLVTQAPGRPRLHRRGLVVGALIVLSLGTGVTAAAASPDVRDGAAAVIAAAGHVLRPPAAVPHRTAAPAAVPAVRSSTAPPRAVVPVLPAAAHSSAPGAVRGTRAEDGARHSTPPSEDRGREQSGSSGSHGAAGSGAGTSARGTGHGSAEGSSDSGSTFSGSGGHDDGAESGSRQGGESGDSGGRD